MLLSNTAIFAALDDGRLKIDPEPRPRLSEAKAKSPYDSTGVDLTLSDLLLVPDGTFQDVIDIPTTDVSETVRRVYKEVQISQGNPFVLEPQHFVLGRTRERITFAGEWKRGRGWGGLPLLAGRLEGKSSLARFGLLVQFASPTIHCGYSGRVTLEIICLGRFPIMLRPGMPICQLLVEEVKDSPKGYVSQFHEHDLNML
ncbi:MAG TPA: hypothetical protein V6D17_22280 [Candidatus Obscuribacterales bacterium]